MKPIYEFLLWDNCNNNCTFCHQRNNPRIFKTNEQIKILNATLKFLDDSAKFESGSHVLLVGGELFCFPDIQYNLEVFFDAIIDKMLSGQIDLLYINTNLLYENIDLLIYFLNKIQTNKLFSRLKFTTSYDLKYRFKRENDHILFLKNLKMITDTYKDINVVVNSILTKYMCNVVQQHDFDFVYFIENYKVYINFIPFIINNPELGATRETIFKTLKYIDDALLGEYLPRYIANFDLKQEKRLYKYINDEFEYCSCENNKCGHSINFTKYSNNGSCFVCDLKEIFNG